MGNEDKLILKNDKNDKIEKLLSPRIPYYFWNIFGFITGIFLLFIKSKTFLIIFSIIFIFYQLLNIFFDFCCVSFDYHNVDILSYKKLGIHYFFITNKKYYFDNKTKDVNNKWNTKVNDIETNNNYIETINNDTYTEDTSILIIELSIYIGDNNYIKEILYYIYLFGITQKNYTNLDKKYFNIHRINFFNKTN